MKKTVYKYMPLIWHDRRGEHRDKLGDVRVIGGVRYTLISISSRFSPVPIGTWQKEQRRAKTNR